MNYCEHFNFNSGWNENVLQCFEHTTDEIWFFLGDHFDFLVEKDLRRKKGGKQRYQLGVAKTNVVAVDVVRSDQIPDIFWM